MDLNVLLYRHQVALMRQQQAANDEERRTYRQFARDYSVQIQIRRVGNGAPTAICGFPT
jgi:hypothetical protein